MNGIAITARIESWAVAGTFTISRGARREARVVVCEAHADGFSGRGECVPYARYGETVEGVVATIAALGAVEGRGDAARRLAPGAALNGVDCALWDLEAKRTGVPAWRLAGLKAPPQPLATCYTLSLASAGEMADAALSARQHPLLKLKLGGGAADAERMAAVRTARPDARLVADANEAWQPADLDGLLAAAVAAGVEMIEQPLPAGDDHALRHRGRWPLPICADEAAHAAGDLAALTDRYDGVNIKLDKAGGLTGALAAVAEARRVGLRVMVGCMLSTSLSMAPAMIVSQNADWVDLDGPLLLAADREAGLRYGSGLVYPPTPQLWG